MLLQNYCELIKLNSFQKKLDIHRELLQKDINFSNNFTPVDSSRFKRIYQYINYQDDKFKSILKANLLRDVAIFKSELHLK